MDHGAFFYLVSWCLALGFALALLWSIRRIPFFRASYERWESGRTGVVPRYRRLGGAVLVSIFLLLLLADRRFEWTAPLVTLWIGSLAILWFSLVDDLSHIAWPWHLAFQILLSLLVYSAGMRLDVGQYLGQWQNDPAPVLAALGVVAWVLVIMNAINWADGTDGLMPGIALLSFSTLFVLALRPEVNQPTIAILAVILSGLALGLLFFNWHPARILAGTGGAYFFGFTLAVLALYAGMKVATLLLVLAIPVLDALIVVARRLVLGRSPFLPDQAHLHHLLLARGWQPTTIAFAFLTVTGLMALLALSLEGGSKAVVFLIAGVLLTLLTLVLHASLHTTTATDRSV
ncbi:MAG: MraY family glycosyltransferase [Candidatus Moraniibacteriota bacterium]